MQEKKRQKEEREIIQRLKPLAKLQTGQDFEDFVEGIICKHYLFYLCSDVNVTSRGIDSSKTNPGATALSSYGFDFNA